MYSFLGLKFDGWVCIHSIELAHGLVVLAVDSNRSYVSLSVVRRLFKMGLQGFPVGLGSLRKSAPVRVEKVEPCFVFGNNAFWRANNRLPLLVHKEGQNSKAKCKYEWIHC